MTALQNGITENNKNQLFIYNKINHSLKKKKLSQAPTFVGIGFVLLVRKETPIILITSLRTARGKT